MFVYVDCDGREFILNMDAISCIVPNFGYSEKIDGDKTYLVEISKGGHYPITKREFHQITEQLKKNHTDYLEIE
ncbi:hypothetical protein VB834_05595 [Limnoraphis robusta Tam1]|uniref:hypothetical protein n=1 Tax=Limnoraphis robusta TaxID=1118279 RepID=UPI002B1ECA62|nr:hypothetical protein [Limnoraphis robusta]MEA5496202.1 hypothetical protein [Limnoraphis robusta BA-68 BA1]MEA5538504.1 hypothetical protein [Limnoraphis robusta Tam1]